MNFLKRTILFFAIFLSLNIGFAQNNSFETLKSLEIMDQIYEHLDLYFVDETKNRH